MCGLFNLDVWDYQADYLVVDDFDFDFFTGGISMRKALWGAQKEFTATDKYKRKRKVDWGKPMIWLCNEDDDPFVALNKTGTEFILKGANRTWYEGNCVKIVLTAPLFVPMPVLEEESEDGFSSVYSFDSDLD